MSVTRHRRSLPARAPGPRVGRGAGAWLAAAVLACVLPAAAQAVGPNATYGDFQAMSLGDLATLQVKLTYVGPGDESVPSILFTSDSNTPDITRFTPYRRSTVPYFNDDDVPSFTFQTTTSELKGVIDSVGQHAAITAGVVTEPMLVSFALFNDVSGEKVFESVVDAAQAMDLFDALRSALAGDEGLGVIEDMACMLAAIDPIHPADVSGQVTVTLSGFRLDYATGRFVATARVENTGSSIAGPITLVLDHQAPGFRLANRSGTTCGLSPVGRDYVHIAAEGETLVNGGVISTTLEFADPERLLIRSTFTVFAGPGSR